MLNYIHWHPDPEIFNVLGLPIRYYGLFFVSGLLLCISILRWIYKRENISVGHLDTLSVYAMIGIIAGARLGHCLLYEPAYFLSNPLEIFLPFTMLPGEGMRFIGYQGLASHGGAFGLMMALFFYARKTKHRMMDAIDLIAVVAALAGGCIRLGNLMNSEIIGIPTTKPWGFIFEREDDVPRHPAQLYEAILYFIIFAIMIFLYKHKRAHLKNGSFFGLILVLVFIARFIIEFYKENQVGFEDGMLFNMGQLLSLPYIIVGLGFILFGYWKTKPMRTEFCL